MRAVLGLLPFASASHPAWPLVGHGSCNDGWLKGHPTAPDAECRAACAADARCATYCHGTGNGQWNCLLYTSDCASRAQTLDGDDMAGYACFQRPVDSATCSESGTCEPGGAPAAGGADPESDPERKRDEAAQARALLTYANLKFLAGDFNLARQRYLEIGRRFPRFNLLQQVSLNLKVADAWIANGGLPPPLAEGVALGQAVFAGAIVLEVDQTYPPIILLLLRL
jgi:hypothetical protein